MLLERAADLNGALRRRFLTGIEDQRHAVAGWDFYQPTRSFGFLVLLRTADDCVSSSTTARCSLIESLE